MALLTGVDPTTIEDTWDEQDVNMTLLVRKAQEDARVEIANTNKVHLTDVPLLSSVTLLRERQLSPEEKKDKRRAMTRRINAAGRKRLAEKKKQPAVVVVKVEDDGTVG